MKPKIAIIGKGNVGSALKRGLERAGYAVRSTGKEEVKETATWGEVVIIGVPFTAIEAVVQQLGNAIEKKVVVRDQCVEHRDAAGPWFFNQRRGGAPKEGAKRTRSESLQYRFCPAHGYRASAGPAAHVVCRQR